VIEKQSRHVSTTPDSIDFESAASLPFWWAALNSLRKVANPQNEKILIHAGVGMIAIQYAAHVLGYMWQPPPHDQMLNF
jgi:NADPH:quinone reductase-like Zn-dependent oxidoreductase